MNELAYPWNNLSVEVAVKIYGTLYSDHDDTSAIYEFMPEAVKIIEQYSGRMDIGESELETLISSVMRASLNHTFEPGAFASVAELIISRVEHLRSMNQLISARQN
jgi:hypothetical protein